MTPSSTPTAGQKRLKLLGVAKPSTRRPGTYVVVEPAEVGQKYGLRCPKCGHGFAIQPTEGGARLVRCSQCSTPVVYVATQTDAVGTTASPESEQAHQTVVAGRGGLHLMGAIAHGRWLFRKVVALRMGANYIGRVDERHPSDIEFNDGNMSARSVRIDVSNMDSGGYSFKLTVVRATNPVYVNGTQYAVGESVYLNFGDKLKMGSTKLEFTQAKEP